MNSIVKSISVIRAVSIACFPTENPSKSNALIAQWRRVLYPGHRTRTCLSVRVSLIDPHSKPQGHEDLNRRRNCRSNKGEEDFNTFPQVTCTTDQVDEVEIIANARTRKLEQTHQTQMKS
jgi:hypothetical protein